MLRTSAFSVALLGSLSVFLAFASSVSSMPDSGAPAVKGVTFPDLYEASIAELQDGLSKGHFSSVDLVKVSRLSRCNSSTWINHFDLKAYFARIEEVNLQGPTLRAVIELNPSALKQAEELDKERKKSGPRSPLHGIPITVKDNIATIASEGT